MIVRELMKQLKACDPQAVVIPGALPFLDHFTWPITSVRRTFAFAKTKEGVGTKYIERPVEGNGTVNVVVIR